MERLSFCNGKEGNTQAVVIYCQVLLCAGNRICITFRSESQRKKGINIRGIITLTHITPESSGPIYEKTRFHIPEYRHLNILLLQNSGFVTRHIDFVNQGYR